jgi:hypothetical protein
LVYFGTIPKAIAFFGNNGHALPPATNPADFFIDRWGRGERGGRAREEREKEGQGRCRERGGSKIG